MCSGQILKLHAESDDSVVFVNLQAIQWMAGNPDGDCAGSRFYWAGDEYEYLDVRETPEQIEEMMKCPHRPHVQGPARVGA